MKRKINRVVDSLVIISDNPYTESSVANTHERIVRKLSEYPDMRLVTILELTKNYYYLFVFESQEEPEAR